MKLKEQEHYLSEPDPQEPDPQEGEYNFPVSQQRTPKSVKGRVSEAAGSLKLGKRAEAVGIAIKRNRAEGIKAAVKGVFVAMLEPENVIEDNLLMERTRERREQMAEDRKTAREYIKIGDAYYKHVAFQYLDSRIEKTVWQAFFEQNHIPEKYRYTIDLFGFYDSFRRLCKPRYQVTDEVRNQLLVSLARLVFSDYAEIISKAMVVYRPDGSGGTDYMIDALASVDNLDIPHGVAIFIYQPPESLAMTQGGYEWHRQQSDPWNDLAPENNEKARESKRGSK